MVDVDEFVKLQQGHKNENDFKLATVVELFEIGTAKITFWGEDTPSEKEYSYLSSYKPTVSDTVLIVPFTDTYIIAGKILFKAVVEEGESPIMQADLDAALSNYTTTTTLQADYAKKTDLDPFIADGDTVNNLTFSWLRTTAAVNAEDFSHGSSGNSSLGFYGASRRQKTSVANISSTAATPEQVRTALFNLLTVLKNLGLV